MSSTNHLRLSTPFVTLETPYVSTLRRHTGTCPVNGERVRGLGVKRVDSLPLRTRPPTPPRNTPNLLYDVRLKEGPCVVHELIVPNSCLGGRRFPERKYFWFSNPTQRLGLSTKKVSKHMFPFTDDASPGGDSWRGRGHWGDKVHLLHVVGIGRSECGGNLLGR